ncbi:MAG: hypothetical protein CMJ19_02730 [Phycisphaeraceae bacterium]|nr:hypothetical protein [Phycisphaeraceae bacterium]
MDLTQDLKALRDALPYGAIQRIADQLERSRYHVESVFLQRYQDDKVIELAIEEVKKVKRHKATLSESIREAIAS